MQTLKALSYFLLHSFCIMYYTYQDLTSISFQYLSELAIKSDCSIRFTDQICETQDNHNMRMLENPKGPRKHFALNSISINYVSVNKVNDWQK